MLFNIIFSLFVYPVTEKQWGWGAMAIEFTLLLSIRQPYLGQISHSVRFGFLPPTYIQQEIG